MPAPSRPQPAPPVITIPRPAPVPLPAWIPAEAQHSVELEPRSIDLKQTSAARQQAERLKQRAAVELKRAEAVATRNLSRAHVIHRDAMTAEIAAARSWVADPQAARRAVIASVILGPPVGL
jgi:hypothetical protein